MGSKIQQVVRVLRFDAEHWAENVKVEKVSACDACKGRSAVLSAHPSHLAIWFLRDVSAVEKFT